MPGAGRCFAAFNHAIKTLRIAQPMHLMFGDLLVGCRCKTLLLLQLIHTYQLLDITIKLMVVLTPRMTFWLLSC